MDSQSRFSEVNIYLFLPSADTALHLAASRGQLDSVKLILQYSGEAIIRNLKNQLASDLTKDEKILQLLTGERHPQSLSFSLFPSPSPSHHFSDRREGQESAEGRRRKGNPAKGGRAAQALELFEPSKRFFLSSFLSSFFFFFFFFLLSSFLSFGCFILVFVFFVSAFDADKMIPLRKSSLPIDPIYVTPRGSRTNQSRRRALARSTFFSAFK